MIDFEQLKSMMHSPVHNYIVPGLTSWLLGEPSEHGKVRLFSCERNHLEYIAPHSHRYDFQCIVLRGTVRNLIFTENRDGEEMVCTTVKYGREIGSYVVEHAEIKRYSYNSTIYSTSQQYAMKHNEIHSIYFSKDALVLFLEGPELKQTSLMLEPFINGKRIPTGTTHYWMFERPI